MPKLVEAEDFYYNEQGLMVLTEKYLLRRGYCCGNGCQHCPYNKELICQNNYKTKSVENAIGKAKK